MVARALEHAFEGLPCSSLDRTGVSVFRLLCKCGCHAGIRGDNRIDVAKATGFQILNKNSFDNHELTPRVWLAQSL